MEREFIGPYRILRVLGKGGMGTVYEGVHEQIERRVAIKLLNAEFATNREYAERFLNEAKAVNRIGHPGIVQIHDMGQLPDGTAYLVMELLVGETVGQRLKQRGGRLPLDETLSIAKDVGDALDAAHEKGIIHRDLKPDNIMLVADPVAARGERSKLLDFGIAKLVVASSMTTSGRTRVGTVMGTLWYMSPEQLRDTAQVNDRTDVYALGVVLYQLLSGRVPFLADSEVELIAAHLRDTPQNLKELQPELPETLTQLVQKMLEKDSAQRPAMRQVVRVLSALSSSFVSGAHMASSALSEVASRSAAPPIPPTISGPLRQPPSARSPNIEPQGELTPDVPSIRSSTLSSSASQQEAPSRMHKRWRVAVVPALGVLGVCATLLFTLLRHRPDASVKPDPVAPPQNSAAPATPAVPAPDPIAAPDKPQEPSSPAAMNAPATGANASPLPPANLDPPEAPAVPTPAAKPRRAPPCRELPTARCIHGAMTPGMEILIADSLRSAEIALCPNEVLRLQRNGSGFLFEGAVRRGVLDRQALFETSLRGRIGSATLPKSFSIKCEVDKKQAK